MHISGEEVLIDGVLTSCYNAMRGVREMNVNPKERTEYIGIRVTPEEKELLKKLAAAAGLTLTGYLIGEALGGKVADSILKKKEK